MREKIKKSDEEWRSQLTPEEYEITRQKGTEPPFDNKYWNEKRAGTYVCKCCGQPLFDSKTKYDSGSGWPSFYEPINLDNIEEAVDESGGRIRTEVMCSRCEAHLGHVFDDGPEPTGQRYCIDSSSLKFSGDEKKSEE